MQRKMKLIYKLLEYMECHGRGEGLLPLEISGYTDAEVNYHIGLCQQAGYMEVQGVSGKEEPFKRYAMLNLTWAGHEALDQHRGLASQQIPVSS